MSPESSRSPSDLSLEDKRSRLERRATVVRSRLLRAVDALSARSHDATELGHQARAVVVPVAWSAMAVAVAAATTALTVRWVIDRRNERRLGRQIARALGPAGASASRALRATVAPMMEASRPSMFAGLLRPVVRFGTTLAILAATDLAKRAIAERLEARASGPRPVRAPSARRSRIGEGVVAGLRALAEVR